MLTLCLTLSLAAAGPPKLPPLPGQGIPAPTTPQKAEPEPEPKPEPEPDPGPEPEPVRSPTPEQPYVADPFPSDEAPRVTAKPNGQPSVKKTSPRSQPQPARASKPTLPTAEAEPLRVASERELEALAWTPSHSEPDAAPRHVPKVSVVTRTNHEDPPQRGRFSRAGSEPPERSAAFVLGYRQFWIRDALGRSQAWHVGSLEVSPLRRYVRLNLLTEVGVEGGEAAQRGDRADLMVVQKAGLGVQYPHWVTPFVEFQGGAGGARVEMFERNDLIFVYTLGVEAGAQWAVSKWMFIHAAAGWLRPVMRHRAGTIRHDTFTFKVGLGF